MDVVRVPTGDGSPEGVQSAYLLPDRGVVIDPGPPVEDAWDALARGIERSTLSMAGIEHVIVTHWHADHAGLAARLTGETGATLSLHRTDAPLVGNYGVERPRRLDRDRASMVRWGVPEERISDVLEADSPSPVPDAVPTNACEDGDVIAGLTVVHTPGHTAGHIALSTPEALFVGDLLLPTYTPNVGGSDTRLRDPLAEYLSSLVRIERMADGHDARPGHGTSLSLTNEVAAVRSHHHDRSRRTFEAVADGTEPTPWAVATDLFGEMRGMHVKFGAGEATAHLQRLAALDLLEQVADDPLRYRTAADSYPDDPSLLPD